MFSRTGSFEKQFRQHELNLEEAASKLQSYATDGENFSNSIKKLCVDFKIKTDDFFKEGRKLRIAVIGQVKAGKSSFLNTLLFDGKDVLPKAATPKTANLTIIQYGEKNSIEVEFYSASEWSYLIKLSKIDSESNEVKVAKELIQMVKARSIDTDKYIGKENYVTEYPTYDELLGKLNDYAGENGCFTPIVKFIRLTINDEKIKFLEIVDTPGLNDPIASRTDKTREFIHLCDVVFFMSRCSYFLDKTDMELLTLQLPQKGVAKMVFLACQYDSCLNDVVWDLKSLDAAEVDVKTRLKKRTLQEFTSFVEDRKKCNPDSPIATILEDCKIPVFVSSMTHNMFRLQVSEFNEEQRTVYEGLSQFDNISAERLKEIGNFSEVLEKFQQVIDTKDETISLKAANLLPSAVDEATRVLANMKDKITKRISILEKNDIEKLNKSKKQVLAQKNNIQCSVESIFGDLSNKIDKNKIEVLGDIRKAIKEYSDITERSGTETKTGYYEVSASKWYNPFSWFSTELVAYDYTVSYNYYDVSDAVENVRNFANEASSSIENGINEAIDIPKIKRALLNAVVENFDTSDENFDPSYFKLLLEKTMNSLEIPVFHLDVSNAVHEMAAGFSGEIREGSKKSELRLKLGAALAQIFREIETVLIDQVKSIKLSVDDNKNTLAGKLLTDVTKELEVIIGQFKDREKEINRNNELVEVITSCIKTVSRTS